ncbi:ROK family transcriptional regulator [Rhizobium sp. 21-4511-3d]
MSEIITANGSLLSLDLSATDREIFMAIRNQSGLSRVEISKVLSLSKGAVSKALAKLQEAGLVDEEREKPGPRHSGQPMIRIRMRPDAMRFIGLNLSTRGAYVAVSNLASEAVWNSPCYPLEQSRDGIVAQAVELIREAKRNAGGTDIGMFVPAIFSASEDILEVTPKQASIPYHEIRQELVAQFPQSSVVVSSRADIMQSALRPEMFGKVLFLVSFSDGVGGHIFDRNRVIRGGYNQAGNIGGMVPETGPRPSVTDLADMLGCDPLELDHGRLEELFDAGHKPLMDWIESRGATLSEPLSAVVQLLNPQTIVLGGNFPNPVLSALRQHIDLSVYDVPTRMPLSKPDIVISDVLGEASRATASAILPLAKYLSYLD